MSTSSPEIEVEIAGEELNPEPLEVVADVPDEPKPAKPKQKRVLTEERKQELRDQLAAIRARKVERNKPMKALKTEIKVLAKEKRIKLLEAEKEKLEAQNRAQAAEQELRSNKKKKKKKKKIVYVSDSSSDSSSSDEEVVVRRRSRHRRKPRPVSESEDEPEVAPQPVVPELSDYDYRLLHGRLQVFGY